MERYNLIYGVGGLLAGLLVATTFLRRQGSPSAQQAPCRCARSYAGPGTYGSILWSPIPNSASRQQDTYTPSASPQATSDAQQTWQYQYYVQGMGWQTGPSVTGSSANITAMQNAATQAAFGSLPPSGFWGMV